jgi:glycosyl transferase family 2
MEWEIVMNLVSIVTPVAPYHANLLPRCVASVEAQTSPATHIVVHDVEQRGAGAARNQGLRQVETPFVVFLDADDQIEPTFLEACLNAYDEKHYIFTDWYQNDEVKSAPDCAWTQQKWHVITTLLPTVWVRHVGGFDENLVAGEDTHLYMKLTRGGMCGKRLAQPLFRYGKGGLRSKQLMNGQVLGGFAYTALMKRLTDEFGGKPMACCGETSPALNQAVNEQLPGMVLAEAIWGGNRQVNGVKTGFLYPRTGNGKSVWVYPEDAYAAPHLFRIVRPSVPTAAPAPPRLPVLPRIVPMTAEPETVLQGAAEVAHYINENSADPEKQPQALPEPGPTTIESSDQRIDKAVRKARKAMNP